MDCHHIETRLREIRKEAKAARKCLRGANTGKLFHRALEVIVLHVEAIRNEVASPSQRPPNMEN